MGHPISSDPPCDGRDAAFEGELRQILPLAYEELRALAGHLVYRRSGAATPRATSLVHETFLRLASRGEVPYRDRGHFLAVAARAMRWVLVDYARHAGAAKRTGNGTCRELGEGDAAPGEAADVDLLALDEALIRLAAMDERKARVVELRFFGGLGVAEVAEVLGHSPATVKRDWAVARAWLFREIGGGGARP